MFLFKTSILLLVLAVGLPTWATTPTVDVEEDGKIVGGSPTTIQNFPYQVSLQVPAVPSPPQYPLPFQHICGASIVAPSYVVTAANCTDGTPAAMFTIFAGSTYSNSALGLRLPVRAVYQHPQYTSPQDGYDISVVQVLGVLYGGPWNVFSTAPIPLCSAEMQVGGMGIITGWGTTSQDGPPSTTLMVAAVPRITNEKCNSEYGGGITSDMLCAGYVQGGIDTCQGDSGGPLAYNGELCGITSFRNGCAQPGFAGVYTDVYQFRDFITGYTGAL